jgi:hypothetical protein
LTRRLACVGRGRFDTNLIINGSPIDSLILEAGHIQFVVFHSLTGTLTQDGSYVEIGPIHLTGSWAAGRERATP